MATIPTPAQVQRAILDKIATYKPRPGDIVPFGAVHFGVQENGYRADEINSTLQSMMDAGLIEQSGSFIKLTQAGFDIM